MGWNQMKKGNKKSEVCRNSHRRRIFGAQFTALQLDEKSNFLQIFIKGFDLLFIVKVVVGYLT